MKTQKRTYSLPQETIARFEKAVEPGRRSTVVEELMRDWLDAKARQELRRDIIAGCEDMYELYLEIEKEYHPLDEEADRGLDS